MDMPFLRGLIQYAEDKIIPFHTPGHKQGRGMYAPLRELLGRAAEYDVSDVLSSQKFNNSWSDALQAAEARAAEIFGARATRFMINGTTGAVHIMLTAARMHGFTHVVMPRSAHLSVYGALLLADMEPIYVADHSVADWQLPGPPDDRQYAKAEANLDDPSKAVALVTYPNYYGLGVDLKPLAERLHIQGRWLLVDEAHGPHFHFHPKFPQPALQQGADLVAQSTHKVLGALTQASMLHIGSERVPLALVDRANFWLQSTSPSALLFASLEAAGEQMAEAGEALWQRAIERAETAACRIESHKGMQVLRPNDVAPAYVMDPTRLVVRTADVGWSGVAAARRLRQAGIQVEMADPWHIVALITWADDEETVSGLIGGLVNLAKEEPSNDERPLTGALPLRPIPKMRLRPREAALAPSRRVPLQEAVGHVSADVVCPYPPGIPILCPGEEIDADIVEYLQHVHSSAFELRGTCDPDLSHIHIVQEGTCR